MKDGQNSVYAFKVTTDYYLQNRIAGVSFGQTLNTVAGVVYDLSFDMNISGGSGNLYSVTGPGGVTFTSGEGGDSVWHHYTGIFAGTGVLDKIVITISSAKYAYVDVSFDNFVATPRPAAL